jgi:cytochrome P450/nitrite reductase/ring-hydroxylating ferredoxin subunit
MSGDEQWTRAAKDEEVLSDRPFGAAVDGADLVLVRTGGGVRAYEARCPHQGTLLSEGDIRGSELVCRAHGWRFDCATGRRLGPEDRPSLVSIPCRIESGFVEVSPQKSAALTVRARRRVKDLPGPRGWPLLGNALELRSERVHQCLESWAERYGSLYRFRLGRRQVMVVGDAKITEGMLRARPGSFRRMGAVEPVLRELGARGVFSVEGETWRRERRLAMEALAGRHLRAFYPTLLRVAERLEKRWMKAAAEGRTVAIVDDLMRFTVDVTTSLTFGTDMNTLENDEVIQRHLALLLPAANRRLFSPFPYWRYVRLPADRRLDRAQVEIRKTLESLIGKARTRLETALPTERDPQNFLEAMLLARDDEGRVFSDEVIFGNALTMLLAGEDTTANSLGWITHEILDRPDVRARLIEEVDAVLGGASIPPDLDRANRLPYADAVAQETLRLRPVAIMIALEANEDVLIDDVALPRGEWVYGLLRQPALDERNFTDARAFRPDRWITPPAEHTPGAHMPFGSGPRICPGRTLALLEIRVVLAMMMKRFEIERVGVREDVRERFSFTMVPKNLNVRFHARTNSESRVLRAGLQPPGERDERR